MKAELATLVNQIRADAGPNGDLMHAAVAIVSDHARHGLDVESLIPQLSSQIRAGQEASESRRAAGAFYTPPPLVELMLEHTLEPWRASHPDRWPHILDPSCGTGRFLLAAGDRLVSAHCATTGVSPTQAWQEIGPRLLGFDSDPLATAWLRGRITMLAGGHEPAAAGVRCIDAFDDTALPAVQADIVLGNPPFGTPLRQVGDVEAIRRRSATLLDQPIGPYADLAAIFLLLSARVLRPGGRLSLVQPLSILAARDTASIRAAILSDCSITFSWASESPVFEAQVYTCAIGIRVGPSTSGAMVDRWADLPPRQLSASPPPTSCGTWSTLASAALGIPDPPAMEASGVIGDVALATADFRDQFYGLRGAIVECDGDTPTGYVPVVTSGVLDVARCKWGEQDLRLLGQRWRRPIVRLETLSASMQTWAATRLVAKIMLPTQTRVLEPVLDESGRWLPSVPIISVTAGQVDLPRIAALLASPLLSLIALHRHLGTARHPQAIKLAARDVIALPMPANTAPLDAAGREFKLGQSSQRHADRMAHLRQSSRHIHTAYGLSPEIDGRLHAWWAARVPGHTVGQRAERPVHL